MKTSLLLLVIPVILSCTGGLKKENVASEDSIASDTPVTDSTHREPGPGIADSLALEERLSELQDSTLNKSNDYFSIAVEADGYEYTSSATWLVDQNLVVRYYETRWAQEGIEGQGTYFLDGNIECCHEEEDAGGSYSTVTKACRSLGGFTAEWPGDEATTVQKPVEADFFEKKYAEIMDYYRNTFSSIKDEKYEEEGDQLVFTLLRVVDVGEEHKETTRITISKELFDRMQ
jgi:hypothetical protein